MGLGISVCLTENQFFLLNKNIRVVSVVFFDEYFSLTGMMFTCTLCRPLCSAGSKAGLGDCEGLFQPNIFCHFVSSSLQPFRYLLPVLLLLSLLQMYVLKCDELSTSKHSLWIEVFQ